jgi:hypothetical protein
MKMNYEFLNTFGLSQQMTIGKMYDHYVLLTSKHDKNQKDLDEINRLVSELRPYTDNPVAPAPIENRHPAKTQQDNRGIVLNVQKVAAARLSGARELALHRDSVALGRLLIKPTEFLSAGEKAQREQLSNRLLGFVGPLDRAGREADLKVAA